MATRKIKDGHGSGNTLKIDDEGAAFVVVHPHPPVGELISPLPFSQFFTDDGTSAGSNDMRVNGATTNQEFYITAQEECDIYIKSITIQISDAGAKLDKFGALNALSNGIQFYYEEQKIGELVITESIKTNLDFFRDSTTGKSIGDGATAFLADLSGGGADTYFPEFDFRDRFGLEWGLRLVKGSTDRIVFRVRDNLSVGMDAFNIKGYGIQI